MASEEQEQANQNQDAESSGQRPTTSATVHANHAYFGEVHLHHQDRRQLYKIQVEKVDVDRISQKLRKKLKRKISAVVGSQGFEPVKHDVIRERLPTREEFGIGGALLRHKHVPCNARYFEVKDLFTTAKHNAETEAEIKCNNQEAKDEYVKTHGNLVGVVGIAGIGKTTLGKQFLKFALSEYGTRVDFFVFYILLRDLTHGAPVTVLQFLLRSSLSDWEHSTKSDRELLRRIKKSRHTFIIIDGLDEARMPNLSETVPAMGLFESSTPDVIFKNLQSGHILSRAHKMLISRPGAYQDLNPTYVPIFTTCVVGFGEESQSLLIDRLCQNEEESAKVKSTLDENSSAKDLCFIPVFANLVIPYAQRLDSEAAVFSFADVFSSYVIECFQSPRFTQKPRDLLKLSLLAFKGMHNNRVTFDDDDLQQCGVDAKLWEEFINLQWRFGGLRVRILEGNKVYFFSHLLWQEYFASLHLMFVAEMDTFKRMLEEDLQIKEWEMVLRFLFGLLNPVVLAKLKSGIRTLLGTDFDERRRLLEVTCVAMTRRFAESCYRDFPVALDSIHRAETVVAFSSFMNRADDDLLFRLCALAYESRLDEVARSIASALPDMILISKTILPSHVTSLCHVLKATDRRIVINVGCYIEPASFTGNGLCNLFQQLETTGHKIIKFCIQNRKITPGEVAGLIQHLPDMKELNLRRCELTQDNFRQIMNSIITSPNSVDVLDLTGNTLDPTSVEMLSRCLHKFERLDLEACGLGPNQVELLTSRMHHNPFALKYFNVSNNRIGSRGVESIASVVHKIERLHLRECDLVDDDLENLGRSIADLPRPLKWVFLSKNSFGPGGMNSLSHCIHNIEILALDSCNIDSDLESLTNAIATLKIPMKILSLTGNRIDLRGLRCVSLCIRNIEMLYLDNCDIVGADMAMLTEAIAALQNPIKMLFVDSNPLMGDVGGQMLASCAGNIEILSRNECGISDAVEEKIRFALPRHQNVMTTDMPGLTRDRRGKRCAIQ